MGYIPEDTLRFLRRHFNEQAKGRILSYGALETRLDKLTDLTYADDSDKPGTKGSQRKRGVIDASGDLLKWLFGTANEKDLHELKLKLQTMRQSDMDIVHALEDQATLLTTGLHRTSVNTELTVFLNKVSSSWVF